MGVGTTFARAWELLRRNWIIVVPAIVIGLAGALVSSALANAGFLSWSFFGDMNVQGPGAFWLFLETIVAIGLRMVGTVIAIGFTVGMAAAAWTTGTARFSDGAAAFRRNGVQAFFALVLLTVLGLVAAALAVPTFALSVLAYLIFMLYAMPAVLVGNRGATDAVIESISLAWRSFGITLAVVLLIIALAIAGGVLGDLLARLPFAGDALGWIVMEAVVAYAAVVVVGEYLQLRPTPNQAP
jgi:hypothetical protein